MTTKKTSTGSTKVKAMKYVDLISRSKEEVSKEELNLEVEMAANKMDQGLLSMKQDLLKHQSDVKSAEIAVSQAETWLNEAKAQRPFDPQNVANALGSINKANDALETVKEKLSNYQSFYDQMLGIKTELFGE